MKHLKEAWTEIDEAPKKKELTVDQMIRKIIQMGRKYNYEMQLLAT